ncbi:MAG: molybdopterin molybdotransferase MoeA, partial [Gemmataceae bacterium]|nr:molybdopterin molybdotransferase MoeA [Gemmataceae bacterium]
MLEIADALATVLKHAKPLKTEVAALTTAAIGQVLAVDIAADIDSPPFAKSLRDGYAVRAADCVHGHTHTELKVIEEVPAGKVPTKPVGPGEATRIFTGAPIPEGADAVVMQEHTTRGDGVVQVTDQSVKPGRHIYPRGTEMQAGGVVLKAGTPINPAAYGVLASVGKTAVPAFPFPRVGIIVTGDEVVEANTLPKLGQIRNSNGPMLAAQTVRG